MYLYNITLIIEEHTADEMLAYLNKTFIPQVIETGLFTTNKLLKVVDSPNEGITYCLQFIAENEVNYGQYVDIYSPIIEGDLNEKFKNRYMPYRTLMEYVNP
jgi:hypothetical protein